MKESVHDGRLTAARLWTVVLRGIPLEFETLLFVVASTLDAVMTWKLITGQFSNGRIWFVESNPIARYVLYSWGLDAMIYFKFGMVAFVVTICQVIARSKLDVARRLLLFATVVVSGVVLYSFSLLWPHL